MSLEAYYDSLCVPFVVVTCAYMCGMAQHIKFNKKTFNNLSSVLFTGMLEGTIYGIGSEILCSILPDHLQGIISIMCILAILNMKIKELLRLIPDCPEDL